MTIYRKIYEDNFGPIPIDEYGRTFEIHHIDGNRRNNSIENLACLSIEDHYNLHLIQEDYSACILLLKRMNLTPEEISKRASEINVQRAKEGKHPSQTEKFKTKMRQIKLKEIADGIHPFCDRQKQSENGRKGGRVGLNDGTHPLLGGKVQRKYQTQLAKTDKHNFNKIIECPHCNRTGKCGPMKRHIHNCGLAHGN